MWSWSGPFLIRSHLAQYEFKPRWNWRVVEISSSLLSSAHSEFCPNWLDLSVCRRLEGNYLVLWKVIGLHLNNLQSTKLSIAKKIKVCLTSNFVLKSILIWKWIDEESECYLRHLSAHVLSWLDLLTFELVEVPLVSPYSSSAAGNDKNQVGHLMMTLNGNELFDFKAAVVRYPMCDYYLLKYWVDLSFLTQGWPLTISCFKSRISQRSLSKEGFWQKSGRHTTLWWQLIEMNFLI